MASDTDTIRATQRYRPYKKRRFWIRPGRTSAWGDNFVLEKWWENSRITRRNLLKLRKLSLPNVVCKTPKNVIVWTQNIVSFLCAGERKTFVPFLLLKLHFQIYPA